MVSAGGPWLASTGAAGSLAAIGEMVADDGGASASAGARPLPLVWSGTGRDFAGRWRGLLVGGGGDFAGRRRGLLVGCPFSTVAILEPDHVVDLRRGDLEELALLDRGHAVAPT